MPASLTIVSEVVLYVSSANLIGLLSEESVSVYEFYCATASAGRHVSDPAFMFFFLIDPPFFP